MLVVLRKRAPPGVRYRHVIATSRVVQVDDFKVAEYNLHEFKSTPLVKNGIDG
jgi:hypothetical protein